MNVDYKALYIWVEGEDDVKFFDMIKERLLDRKYDWIAVVPYRKEKKEKVCSYLKSIKAMNANYIFVADIDFAPCVTGRKHELRQEYRDVDEDRIMVVIKAIESWYLAGLDETCCRKLGVRPFTSTDSITKAEFNSFIPKKFGSRIDYMLEILKSFSKEIAKQQNR